MLAFNQDLQETPLWNLEDFKVIWQEEGFTHNQSVISAHCDDCPVHCAKQLDHDLLDVVVSEGLQCIGRQHLKF